MSEYQYYEFLVIDRPLTPREIAELRSFSTRARITPTSFINDYSWGSFKGNAELWMERYFDAFLYLSSWGSRVFQLRLPARLLDSNTGRLYCICNGAALREHNASVILTFESEDEDGGEWIEGEGCLSTLISVRAELARGDHRALYLGWLLCAQSGQLGSDEFEPPVPAGINEPSASLESLVEFLRIDRDLLAVAATASPPLSHGEPGPADIQAWLAELPAAEKDDLLARVIAGDAALANELVQRVRREGGNDQNRERAASRRRTVAELLGEGQSAAAARRRSEAEAAARESARREREAAIAMARHLDSPAGNEPGLWTRVEELIAARQPNRYDEAVGLLLDLRELAARKDPAAHRLQMQALRARHARKSALIDRLDKAGL